MSETRAALNEPDFMKALLDLIIPPSANGDLPGAGALGLSAAVVTLLQADQQIRPVVEAGIQAVQEAALSEHPEGLPGMTAQAGAKVIEGQLAAHPFFIMALLRYLYPAYYQHPRVLEGIGEPARPPFPEGFDVEAIDEKLLESLRRRRKE